MKKFISHKNRWWACTWHDIDHPPVPTMFNEKERGFVLQAYIFQHEIAPSTGGHHFQAFFQFESPVYLARIQRVLALTLEKRYKEDGTVDDTNKGLTAGWWTPLRSSIQEARDYCAKIATRANPNAEPITFGEFELHASAPQGQFLNVAGSSVRDDNTFKAIDIIKGGGDIKQVWQEAPLAFVYSVPNLLRAIQVQKNSTPRDPNIKPEVIVYFGPPGSGKTRKAIEENPDAYQLPVPQHSREKLWFTERYIGQNTVIVDDFKGQIPLNTLLRLIDRYPLEEQVKGMFINIQATRWIFTSNTNPKHWYSPNEGEVDQWEALRRRITKAYQFDYTGIVDSKIHYDLIERPDLQAVEEDINKEHRHHQRLKEIYNQHYEVAI